MGELLTPMHMMVVAVVALVLFGGKKLPELGKGLGEGLKGFREGLKGMSDPSPAATSVQQTAVPAPPAAPMQTESASGKENMEYVTCSRCGNRFENPLGFKVADYVCRTCQKSS